ncbi:MAG: aminotransferase class V-fold PLP-dependent enzyme [Lentisphaeria bacterium]|nr:aminotransferase class V-fold PLP-dependent enzyme [Lentisphaeria bacterium]
MIYFDNAANKKVNAETIKKLSEHLLAFGGNSESRHPYSYNAKKILSEKEVTLFSQMQLQNYEGFYFNSGTEIFNFIRFLINEKGKKCNIVTSKLEHPALSANLKNSIAEIRYIKLKNNYQYDIENLTKVIDQATFMVAINFIQSETGLVQNLEEIIAKIKKINPSTLILIDSIQGFGKCELPSGADFYTASNHKICGIAGAVLIAKKYLQLNLAEIYSKFRHDFYQIGRIEIPQLLAMYDTLKEELPKREENFNKVATINNYIRKAITDKFDSKIYCRFTAENTTPYILQIIFPNYDGAVLAGLLGEKGIMVSSGSACMAESQIPSEALKELGFSNKEIFSTIRLSFSEANTINEADFFIKTLKEVLQNY